MRQNANGGFALSRAELVAICTFASTDETRAHVNSVCFDVGRGRVVTTDGHRLGICQAQKAPGPQPDLVYLIALADCKAAIRAAKPKHTICFDVLARPAKPDAVATVEVRIADTSVLPDPDEPGFPEDLVMRMRPRPVNAQFPPVDQVVPRMPHKGQPAISYYSVNASYLADLALVVKAGTCNDRCGGIALFLPDGELDPMMARVPGDGCDWTLVVMPMRSTDPRPEAPSEEAPATKAKAKLRVA